MRVGLRQAFPLVVLPVVLRVEDAGVGAQAGVGPRLLRVDRGQHGRGPGGVEARVVPVVGPGGGLLDGVGAVLLHEKRPAGEGVEAALHRLFRVERLGREDGAP